MAKVRDIEDQSESDAGRVHEIEKVQQLKSVKLYTYVELTH